MRLLFSANMGVARADVEMGTQVTKKRLLALLILLASLPLRASALEYPNRYNSMAETLFDMMDAFSSAYQKRLHERGHDYYGPPPTYAPYPGAPYPAYPQPGFILNGSWQGESGEILVIQNSQFRIYLDRDNYREGRLAQVQAQLILLQDLDSGQIRHYEFVESEGRLLLRDPAGNLLRYIRIGW